VTLSLVAPLEFDDGAERHLPSMKRLNPALPFSHRRRRRQRGKVSCAPSATGDPIGAVPGSAITERMLLRPFRKADLGWLTALHRDPAVRRYTDSRGPAEVVAAVPLPAFLREHAELPAGIGRFAALREPGGEPLGWFGLAPPSSVALQHCGTIG